MTALLVTTASPLGLPMSTTHVSCGSLLDLGGSTAELNRRTTAALMLAWVATLPGAGLIAGAAQAVLG